MKFVVLAFSILTAVGAYANEPKADVICKDNDSGVYEFDHTIGTLGYFPKNGIPGYEVGMSLMRERANGDVIYSYFRESGDLVVTLHFAERDENGTGMIAYGTKLNCTRKNTN